MRNVDIRTQGRSDSDRMREIVVAVRALVRSHSARGSVTVAQNAATTTVLHDAIMPDATVHLTPASAAAAAELAVYVSAVAKGSFTLTHPNNATAGRTWNWSAAGG